MYYPKSDHDDEYNSIHGKEEQGDQLEDIYKATSDFLNGKVKNDEVEEYQEGSDNNILFGFRFENNYTVCYVNGYEKTQVTSVNGESIAKQIVYYKLEKDKGIWKFTRIKTNDIEERW